jgi:hypothetical protein
MARKKSNATSKTTGPSRTCNGKLAKPKPSLSKLTKLAASKTKQFLHSENTTGKYDGYVKRGKEFLASFVEDEGNTEARRKASHVQGLSADGEEEIEGDNMLQSDPEFCHALDGCPVKSTPQAIAMFLAWKCFEQDNGKSTADGIHAAFVAEYDQM